MEEININPRKCVQEDSTISVLASPRELIDKKLEELLVEKESVIIDAARYSVLSTGKRLRPLLVLATAQIYGAGPAKALIPACAIELLHTYSLIHDDLPCMDDDDFRRGRPTLHKVTSEANAILTGDFLLTYSFELLTRCPHLAPDQKLSLIATLSHYAGAFGMIGGQAIDISEKRLSWDELEEMHKKKTAALITASLLFGAIIGKAPSDDLETLKIIGNHLGLAFQIVDDLLDASLEEDKSTAVTLLGPENAKMSADLHFEKTMILIDTLTQPAESLKTLARQMVYRNL